MQTNIWIRRNNNRPVIIDRAKTKRDIKRLIGYYYATHNIWNNFQTKIWAGTIYDEPATYHIERKSYE